MPFITDQPLVRERDDKDWTVEEKIVYQGNTDRFTVDKGDNTDFASVAPW